MTALTETVVVRLLTLLGTAMVLGMATALATLWHHQRTGRLTDGVRGMPRGTTAVPLAALTLLSTLAAAFPDAAFLFLWLAAAVLSTSLYAASGFLERPDRTLALAFLLWFESAVVFTSAAGVSDGDYTLAWSRTALSAVVTLAFAAWTLYDHYHQPAFAEPPTEASRTAGRNPEADA